MPAPPSITLTYRIPKTLLGTSTEQRTRFSSLVLPQRGELDILQMNVTADAVTDHATYLERNLTLTARVPGYANVFGASENPAVWDMKSLWGQRIEKLLSIQLLPVP